MIRKSNLKWADFQCTKQSQSYTVSGGEKLGSRPVRFRQFLCPCAFIVKACLRYKL
ncbi:uncharacterized protein MELLADRAFT_57729, partial [Melampsora larici-populina 98AG31]